MRSRGGVFASLTAAVLCCVASAVQAGVLITINKASQQMSVAIDGVPRYTWPVSTGRSGYATPSGTFTPFRLEEDHYSKEWDEAPMPHSIFFTKVGHAIHGTYETKRLGAAVSHGCVRLAPQNAATLFALVKAEGLSNTRVVLTGQAPPLVAGRPAQRPSAREPLELQQYRSQERYQDQYQPPYGRPAYQPYGAQPQYGPPYAVQPQYQQSPYGMQRYDPRSRTYDPRY
jgi:hypothetical protein